MNGHDDVGDASDATGEDRPLVVWRAHAEPPSRPVRGVPGQVTDCRPDSGEVAVLTGDGLLVLERVTFDTGPARPASEVIESTRQRLGIDVATRVARLDERVEHVRDRLAPVDPDRPDRHEDE